MTIKRVEVDLKPEQEICAGIILSDVYTKDIITTLTDLHLVKSPILRSIISWSISYYNKYKKAPGNTIFDILESKRNSLQPDMFDSIEMALSSIADRYFNHSFNEEYYLSNGREYIAKRRVEIVLDRVNGFLAGGSIKDAEHELLNYKKVLGEIPEGLDIFSDPRALDFLTEDEETTLFSVPGDFGKLLGPLLRGDLFNIAGLTKRGKSWFLLYMAQLAYLEGLNVVYFSLEMEKRTVIPRIFRGLLGQTIEPTTEHIELPYFEGDGTIETKWVHKSGLNFKDAKRLQKNINRQSGTGTFKLFTVTETGFKLSGMVHALERMEEITGIVADAIFIDYIDIAEAEQGMFGKRFEVLDMMWLYAKRNIAQRRNAFVATVSQVGRECVDADAGIENSAGAFSKTFHVSQWVNINQSEDEARANIMRASITGRNVNRKNNDVVILQCLDIGRPVLDSKFIDKVKNLEEYVANAGI